RPVELDSRLKYNTQFFCSKSGFFRDPLNCNKFYRCVDFNGDGLRFAVFKFDCPKGLVFDEEEKLCNWPSAAPPCQDVRIQDEYPIEEDTSDERNAKPQPIPVPDGGDSPVSDSDPTQEGASSPSDSDPIQDGDSPVSDSDPTQEGASSPSGSDPIQGGDPSISGGDSTQEGTSTGDDGDTIQDGLSSPDGGNSTKDAINIVCFKTGYFRHPTNCSKFYRCVNTSLEETSYYIYIFECPKDLWFDETIESCNWKSSSPSCNSEASSESQQNGDSILDSTVPEKPEAGAASYSYILKHADKNNEHSGIILSPKSPDVSELVCTHEGFFRHPTDCGKFYGCADLTGSNMTFNVFQYDCPDGFVFDQTTCFCKLPQFAPPCTSSASENATITDESQPFPPSEQGSRFVIYQFECVDELVFDETIKSCNWPHKAPPCNDPSSSKISPDSSGQKIPVSEGEKQPQGPGQRNQTSINESSKDQDSSKKDNIEATDRNDISGDYGHSTEDKSGQKESGQSENGSTVPVESNKISDSETSGPDGVTSSSQEINNNQLVCSKPGVFRHPENCSKFYMCHNLTDAEEPFAIYIFDCPNDLVFDENINSCNDPNQTLPCNNESGVSTAEDVTDSTSSYETTPSADQVTSGVGNSSQTITDSQPGATDAQQGEMDTKPGAEESLQEETDSQSEGEESPSQKEDSVQNKEDEHLAGESVGSEQTSEITTQASKCKEVGFFRNPNNCNRFYRCVKQGARLIKYDFNCPDRLVFDEIHSVCTWASQTSPCSSPRNESLSGGSTSESGSPTGDASTEDGSSTGDASTEGGSSIEGASTESESSTEGPSTESGSPTGDASTEDGSSTGDASTENGSSTGDPSTENGSSTEGASAESGTLLGGDTSSGGTTVESEDETLGSTTTLSSSGPPEENTESSLPETGGTPSREGNALCPKAGFFRNPRDCHKFYRCVDFEGNSESFVIFEFNCPDGLVFDESISVCNWPDQAPPCGVCPPVDGAENSTNGTLTEETTLPMSTTTENSTNGTLTEETTLPMSTTTENSTNGTLTEETTLPMSTTTELTQTTTRNTITVDVGSLYDCQVSGNFPFESDCIRFYRCVERESGLIGLLYRCPDGYIYDEKVALCRRKPTSFICGKDSPNSLIFRADPFILDNAILATSEFLLD
ncbi:mucin-17-like, partial [Limulus polyphemus]|uniref:Mucin-17-like n=1 Tax=Limulus polyphemus TaxID=6850 RepID=A0ABM1BIU6_LIMPO